MTNSGTRALELIALLLDIQEGDEIIMPSYTFVGTSNPFVTRGAKAIFVDIERETIGLDPKKVLEAITSKTKAIVSVNYNGIGANLPELARIAKENKLVFVEDNAQGFMSYYKDQHLGTFGDFSILSFNYTKNIQCGEGGAIVVNNPDYKDKCEVLYNLGTNRLAFEEKNLQLTNGKMLAQVFPFTIRSSIPLSSNIRGSNIIEKRVNDWEYYHTSLTALPNIEVLADLPVKIEDCQHNGPHFYLLIKEEAMKKALLQHLGNQEIKATFHYIPLHLSAYGKEHSSFVGSDVNTLAVGKS